MKTVRSVNSEIATDILTATLRAMYVAMVKIRKFEEVVGELVSKTRLFVPAIYILARKR